MIKFDKLPFKNIFFTSDTHLGHSNIVRGTSKWDDKTATRDFITVGEHDSIIINNINSTVGKKDFLLLFGDFCFGGEENIEKYRKSIICENVGLIFGNHDHHIRKNKVKYDHLFVFMEDIVYFCIKDFSFIGCHYPISEWYNMNKGTAMLHGHSHSGNNSLGKILDVGIDESFKRLEEYRPFTHTEIIEIINNKQIHKIGHH